MDPLKILESFNALFADSFACEPEDFKGKYRFILTEADKGAKLQKVEIRGVPKESILLKMHKYTLPEKVFKTTKGECKMCDYILLASYKEDLYIIYIEMKSQNLDNRDFFPQLMAGDCFMTYCAALAEKFHGASISSIFLRKRRIVFHTPWPVNKQPIRPKLQNRIRTTPSFPDQIKTIPLINRNGGAFTFFDYLTFDMPDDVR